MQKFPRISVVTPSYNQSEYLERTIQSVLNQGYPNLQYIIIDGKSTDQSVGIIKKYEKKLHYWHSKKDSGQSEAIQIGFDKSDGEIMMWLNSDDVLLPGALFLVASIFENFPQIEWISALPATITPDNFINYVATPPWYQKTLINNGMYTRKFCGFIMQEGTMWRRSLWQKSGGYIKDVPYSMDYDLWRRFSQHADLILIKAVIAAYRLNPNRKNNDNHLRYYREIKSYFPEVLALPIKFIWKKIVAFAYILKIPALIYYDENKQSWFYRSKRRNIRSFKIAR